MKSERQLRAWILVGAAVLLAGGLILLKTSAFSGANNGPSTVVSVDELATDPAHFSGALRVSGTVTAVHTGQAAFDMGCEDACVTVPVTYRGDLPREGTNVIVSGKLQSLAGKYVLNADEVHIQ